MSFDVPRSHQTGRVGALRVMSSLEELGIGVDGLREHDFGMDVFLHTRNPALVDVAAFATAQIKSGPAYFKRPGEQGGQQGWWFTADDGDLDYWQQSTLPHLIVLHDLEKRASYWRRIRPDAVGRTGRRWRILVPESQRIGPETHERLLLDLTESPTGPPLEGTAWIGPTARDTGGASWRLALCAPRLVSPHRNAGSPEPIGPMAAAALVVQHRTRDYRVFADEHASVPYWTEAANHRAWDWRFVHALGSWFENADPGPLRSSLVDAGSPAALAAAVVAACVAEKHAGGAATALVILDAHSEIRRLVPIDRAWLGVHAARLSLERGDAERAGREAAAAVSALAFDRNPMATALRGAAAAIAWTAEDWSSDALERVIRSADNHLAWWRSQSLASAGAELLHRDLERWARTQDRWTMEDDALVGLSAAVRAGAFIAGHANAAAPVARYRLTRAETAVDAAAALDTAILAGDDRAVRLAVARYADSSLLHGIRLAGVLHRDAWWDRSALQAAAAFAEHGGDLLDEASAAELLSQHLDMALRSDGPRQAAAPPGTDIRHYALRASAGLLPAVTADTQRSALRRLVSALDGMPRERRLDELDLRRLLDAFDWSRIPDDLVEAAARAVRDSPALTRTVRAAAAGGRHAASRRWVERAAATGDVLAIEAAAERGVIPSQGAASAALVELEASLRAHGPEAARAPHPRNVLVLLIWLAVNIPELGADWDLVGRGCAAPENRGSRRAETNAYLLQVFERIPATARPRLAAALEPSDAAPALSDWRVNPDDVARETALRGRLGSVLPAALRQQSQDWLLSTDVRLLRATGVLSRHWPGQPRADRAAVAAALLASADPGAAALGATLALKSPSTISLDVMMRTADERGRAFAHAVATNVRQRRSPQARRAIAALAQHPSAAVRLAARPTPRTLT